jgi:hypothetical protein
MRYLNCRRRRRRRQPRDHGAPYQYTAKAWSLDDWDETLAVDKTRFTMFNGMGHCGMCKGVGNNVVG